MPGNDREVFDRLTGDVEASKELAFITYALFAHERREWVLHFSARENREPTQDEIDAWIGNLTDSQFADMRTKAAGFFDSTARTYLSDEIEAAREDALQSAIVREVRAAGAFWKQLAIALVTAILAPILIGASIAAVLLFTDRFPSVRDFARLPPAAIGPPPPTTTP